MSLRRDRGHGDDLDGRNVLARGMSTEDYDAGYSAQESRMDSQRAFEMARDQALRAQYANKQSAPAQESEGKKKCKSNPDIDADDSECEDDGEVGGSKNAGFDFVPAEGNGP